MAGKRGACAWILLAFASSNVSCSEGDTYYSLDDFSSVPKIDAHAHLNSADTSVVEQAITDNFRLLTINVDYPDFPSAASQFERAIEFANRYPGTVRFAATFTMESWEEPGHEEAVIEHLRDARQKGAVAVKVWKNIGMVVRDKQDQLVMIDDDRLDFAFSFLESTGFPLIGHLGEPHNCWLPLEEMTVNNDREYFRAHPQYHMYLHPEMPSYEDQMTARDRRLEKNVGIQFIGAHLASLEWSVDELAAFLDRFPRASVDMAARMGQVQYQSGLDRERVRNFFIKYQDRLMYATDLTHSPDSDAKATADEVHAKWLVDWRYLVSDARLTAAEVDGEFSGLKLPKKVIDKIYFSNAYAAFFAN